MRWLIGEPVDARADQFSFCVALYEALYGERPFQGSTLMELMMSVSTGDIQAPPRRTSVPGWLRKVVLRGLANEPDDRYPTMNALLRALRRDPARQRRRIGLGIAAALA